MAAVGLTDILPASGFNGGTGYTVEGVRAEDWKLQFAMLANTDGDYFEAMGIPLIAGRYFTADDRKNAPLVVIVNQSMAQHCWPGQQAVGRRIHVGNPGKEWPWATVVGVVANTKLGARDEPNTDQWYAPAQQPAITGRGESKELAAAESGYITLRSALPAEEMARTLRSTIGEIDPLLALQQVQPMDEVIANIEGPRRFNTDLITAFAAGALMLAITGIYAVVAFSVTLRRQEIAVRMALGAQRAGIARLVLVSSARLALLGCVIGLAGSCAVSRLVNSFLFGVSATDPWLYLLAVLIMMGITLIASAIPARRAAAADPMDALRAA
jgi:putative ABC transport system permease protein